MVGVGLGNQDVNVAPNNPANGGLTLLIHILSRAYQAFAGYDFGNIFVLALHQLINVGIKNSFGDICLARQS